MGPQEKRAEYNPDALSSPHSLPYRPGRDIIDGSPARESRSRLPTKELIKQGVYPEPADEELFKKETPRPPRFKTQIREQTRLKETEPAHFESQLVPIGDPDMVIEWFKDGVLMKHGQYTRHHKVLISLTN